MTDSHQDRTALVTGATGFVGSHLVKRLVCEDWRVHIVVREHSELDLLKDVEDSVTVHRYDGSTKNLIEIVQSANPGTVFHLASLFISEHKPEDVEPLISSNLLLGTQLLEAMRRAGVSKFINTGTAWQHFNDEVYNPVNLYAATKQAFVDIARFYVEAGGLQMITLELFDTYGPDDHRPKLVNLLQKTAETNGKLTMSPGEQFVDFVHIDDVVEAYLVAAELLKDPITEGHKTYMVSSGRPMPLKVFVRIFEKALGKSLDIEWGGRSYREREVMTTWRQGGGLPSWEAKISLYDGLRTLASASF